MEFDAVWYTVVCPFCLAARQIERAVLAHLLLPQPKTVAAWIQEIVDGHLHEHVEEMVSEITIT